MSLRSDVAFWGTPEEQRVWDQRLRELRREMVTPPELTLAVASDVARLIGECPRWRVLRRRGLRQWHENLLKKAKRDA